MSMRLKHRRRIPHDGPWRIQDPATGVWVSGNDFDQVEHFWYQQRRANGVPIGLGDREIIERLMCEQIPIECESDDPNRPRKRALGLADLVNGARVMLSHWWNNRALVAPEEADRRAAICANCPFNVTFTKPCTGICAELADLVNPIIGAHGTRYDAQLRSCSICACFLSAAIWVPLDIQCRGVDAAMRSMFAAVPHCWKQCV